MKRSLMAIFALAFLVFPGWAQGSWDLVGDYSTINGNPSGVWSYGWEGSGGGEFHHYNSTQNTSTMLQWYDSQFNYISGAGTPPAVWMNLGQSIYGVDTGEVSIHPGPHEERSVVRWTSPITGLVNVSGIFDQGDQGELNYYIDVNGHQAFYFPCDGNYWDSTDHTETFGFLQYVSVGTTIDFSVGNGYSQGNTPLSVTIVSSSSVPVPSAFLLLGSGLLGLLGLRRGFKNGSLR